MSNKATTTTAITFTLTLLLAIVSNASTYSQFYESKDGKHLDNVSAMAAASKSEVVYSCQSVEMKTSKSGTSISLHTIKKPKVTKAE